MEVLEEFFNHLGERVEQEHCGAWKIGGRGRGTSGAEVCKKMAWRSREESTKSGEEIAKRKEKQVHAEGVDEDRMRRMRTG